MTTAEKIQIFIAILVFIASIGGWNIWSVFISNKKNKNNNLEKQEQNETNEKDDYYLSNRDKKNILLTEHPIFSHLQNMDIFFSLHFEIEDKGRELLIKEKIIPKIRIWYKILYEMAEKVQYCTENCSNINIKSCGNSYNICRKAFTQGVEEYRNYHINNSISLDGERYNDKDFETMDIYSEKFNHYHAPSEIMVSEMLNEVFNSIVYKDCYSRIWDFLTACSFAFARVKVDSGMAIKNLNGELTGREFLGITVGDFNYEE